MEFNIPLGSYPGRGIDVPISMSYSSKVWRIDYNATIEGGVGHSGCRTINSAKYAEDSASGWTTSLAAPYIEYTGRDNLYDDNGLPAPITNTCSEAPTNYFYNYVRRLTVHLPSGESHELRADDTVTSYPPLSNCSQPTNPNCSPDDSDLQTNWNRIYYAVDGSNIKYIEDSTTTPATYKLQMPDGSYYDFAATVSAYDDREVRRAAKYTDRNGNFTSYQNGAWTDTMGRTLNAPIGTSAPGSPTSASQPVEYSMPGMTGKYKFHWKYLKGSTAQESGLTDFNQELRYRGDRLDTVNYQHIPPNSYSLFTSSPNTRNIVTADALFNPIVLTKIELPTGQSYKFTYDYYGRIERIYYPTGGEERFVYNPVAPLATSPPNNVTDQANFGVTSRKLYPTSGQSTNYEWNYSVQYVAPAGYKISTTNPDNTLNERVLHRGSSCSGCSFGTFGFDNILAGMPYEELSFSGSNPRKLVARQLNHWTKSTNLTSYVYAERHPRITHQENYIYDSDGNGVYSTTKFEYEFENNLTNDKPLLQKKVLEYGFVAVAGGSSISEENPGEDPVPDPTPVPTPVPPTPIRTTETTYLINDPACAPATQQIYKDVNMIGLVSSSVVKDANGTIVSGSRMSYDDAGYSPALGRGNPTSSSVWDSSKGVWNNPAAYIKTYAKFDIYGNQYEATDGNGNVTQTEYSATYNYAYPTKVTTAVPDPNPSQNIDHLAHGSNSSFVTESIYDLTTGLPLTTKDINGQITTMEYDPVTLRPKKVTPPTGSGVSEKIYHDEPNNYWVKNRIQIDSNNWAESISYFDGLGRACKSEEVNSQGNIFVEKEFDEDGRVKRVTNPFRANETKIWTTNVYDESSRIKEMILPDGAKVKTDYGVSVSGIIGVTKQITDQAGKKRKGISDALGRMIRVIEDPTGQNLNTDYIFDTLGNLRKTIQGEQNRYFTYSSLGRLLRAKQPEQEVNTNLALPTADPITNYNQWSVGYVYDNNGNIIQVTDAKGDSITGYYDKFNRLIYRKYSDNITPNVSLFYDGTGLESIPDYSKGKTTKVSSSVSETCYTSFDNYGRLLVSKQVTDGQIYQSSYNYDAFGKPISQTYPSGRTVQMEYKQDGNIASIQGTVGASNRLYANSIHYNSAGAIEQMRLGNGKWETAKYNPRLQITEIGLGNSSTDQSLLKLEYGYGDSTQNNGSLRSQKISFNGLSHPFEQSYTYDDLNRLKSATESVNSSQTWKQTFNYDRYGNRTFDEENTTTLPQLESTKITNPQINTSDNRLKKDQDNDSINDYDYDEEGNVILDAENKRFVYDAESRQTSFFLNANNTQTPDATYYYDGEGKRVKKKSSTETTIFVYDGAGQMVAEYSTNVVSASEAKISYLTQDHLGSPRIITDAVGNVIARKDFSAFGDETLTAQRTTALGYKPENIRQDYTGYEKDDESGLEYAQARYYNSSHGRFTSIDPLTASTNLKNPQTFNRYAYALNSPYKFTDPLGLLSANSIACGTNCSNSGPIAGGSDIIGTDASFASRTIFRREGAGPAANSPQTPPMAHGDGTVSASDIVPTSVSPGDSWSSPDSPLVNYYSQYTANLGEALTGIEQGVEQLKLASLQNTDIALSQSREFVDHLDAQDPAELQDLVDWIFSRYCGSTTPSGYVIIPSEVSSGSQGMTVSGTGGLNAGGTLTGTAELNFTGGSQSFAGIAVTAQGKANAQVGEIERMSRSDSKERQAFISRFTGTSVTLQNVKNRDQPKYIQVRLTPYSLNTIFTNAITRGSNTAIRRYDNSKKQE